MIYMLNNTFLFYILDDIIYFSAPRDHSYCQAEPSEPEIECGCISVPADPTAPDLILPKVSVTEVSTQTSISMADIDDLLHAKHKLENEKKLRRDLFLKEVTKDDASVNYYTGFRTKGLLIGIFNIILTVINIMLH